MMEKARKADQAESTAESSTARLHEQIAELQAELGKLAAAIGLLGQAGAENLRSKLDDGMADLKDKAGADLHAATQTAESVLADVTDYARRKPISALAIAAGIGLLLGLLTGRR